MGKSVVLRLHVGLMIEMRRVEKAYHPVGFEPTSSQFRGVYLTAVLQRLPMLELLSDKRTAILLLQLL